jgi:asparagine synthetase B (glutamine-hydrolysing)
MCGVLYVESRESLPLQQHLTALDVLNNRGPDFVRYQHSGRVFVAQSVLHITGSADFYNEKRSDFFAYNGEIYNYHEHGAYSNDIELAWHAATHNHDLFQHFQGPWAWIYWDGNQVSYASDPQGEHYLYRYQDDDIVVVCSEVTPILTYIDTNKKTIAYNNKCWTMQNETPWQGIERLEPGRLYVNHATENMLDSIWSWTKLKKYNNINEACEEFDFLWREVMNVMTPTCNTAISYSGGIDSNLILNKLPQSELVSINMIGKDPIIDRLADFLTQEQIEKLNVVDVDFEHYALEYNKMLHQTCMPAQSWSFVGKWLVAKHTKARVLFTGLGADELFGGYGIYQTIEYSLENSHSPYSNHGDPVLWQQCLQSYNNDPRQATLLMDYWYQVIGCDAPGVDRLGGIWGKETRNPFMNKRIMQFALSLPWEFKVNTISKPILKNQFLRNWSAELLLPKQGFAGHANDALSWLNINITPTGDRHQDWKQIAQNTFYRNS